MARQDQTIKVNPSRLWQPSCGDVVVCMATLRASPLPVTLHAWNRLYATR